MLIYPAGVLVNLTTPKLQNWWALRSLRTLQERILILSRQVRTPVLTPFEEFILRCVTASLFIICGFFGFLTILFMVISEIAHQFHVTHLIAAPADRHRVQLMVVMNGLFLLGPTCWILLAISRFQYKHSKRWRPLLLWQLHQLKQKLVKRLVTAGEERGAV